CPDDLPNIDRYPQAPPSILVIFGPILLAVVALVLVAALHAALGAPLGPGWAAEVWSMLKAAIWPALVATSFGAYVRMQHGRIPPGTLPEGRPRDVRHVVPTAREHGRLTTGPQRVLQITA